MAQSSFAHFNCAVGRSVGKTGDGTAAVVWFKIVAATEGINAVKRASAARQTTSRAIRKAKMTPNQGVDLAFITGSSYT